MEVDGIGSPWVGVLFPEVLATEEATGDFITVVTLVLPVAAIDNLPAVFTILEVPVAVIILCLSELLVSTMEVVSAFVGTQAPMEGSHKDSAEVTGKELAFSWTFCLLFVPLLALTESTLSFSIQLLSCLIDTRSSSVLTLDCEWAELTFITKLPLEDAVSFVFDIFSFTCSELTEVDAKLVPVEQLGTITLSTPFKTLSDKTASEACKWAAVGFDCKVDGELEDTKCGLLYEEVVSAWTVVAALTASSEIQAGDGDNTKLIPGVDGDIAACSFTAAGMDTLAALFEPAVVYDIFTGETTIAVVEETLLWEDSSCAVFLFEMDSNEFPVVFLSQVAAGEEVRDAVLEIPLHKTG